MKTAFLLTLTLFTLSACNRISQGPYRNYKITNDEAIPASQIGGPPLAATPLN